MGIRQKIFLGNGHEVAYNKEAVRWLGVWLDSKLSMKVHHKRWISKAKSQQARFNRVCRKTGLPPGSTANLQRAVVQSIATYGIELDGIRKKAPQDKQRVQEFQRVINAQARATTGNFKSTPVGILMAESGMRPAAAIKKGREARLRAKIFGRPQHLSNDNSSLAKDTPAERLRRSCEESVGATEVERVTPRRNTKTKGIIIAQPKEIARRTALEWDETTSLTLWTDGSRLDEGRVGSGVAWKEGNEHVGKSYHLGIRKEVFDAELFAVMEAVKRASKMYREPQQDG